MSKIVDDLTSFVAYVSKLSGDEKGEAQVFCDRLFRAFGHEGYKEAGATLEYRIKKTSSKGTSFADLIWKPRLLIEMKKGGEKLQLHVRQAFDYWVNAVPNRPRYVVLCNFDEFWIYDFDRQLDEPVDRVALKDLPKRYTAFNFLFPVERKPQFNNDRDEVSRRAADKMAELFKRLTRRLKNPLPREQAQRFVLQTVVAMFAEDIDLLPAGTIKGIVDDCLHNKQSSYDLFGGLFRQMNDPNPARGGRFVGVRYFNGGLFSRINPVELTEFELDLIGGDAPDDQGAALKDWSKVNPAIFGTLFQQSMDAAARHAFGAHFTSEADIQRIVGPTIVKPWRERIDAATTMKQLAALRRELAEFEVLDPACGSGNFLYVAFRELARLDQRILLRLKALVSHKEFQNQSKQLVAIRPLQFHGIDLDSFGVELAKVSLMIAKKLALDESIDALADDDEGEFTKGTGELAFHKDEALPLDNLDDNIRCEDALFAKWPKVNAIVGNPPYQSKNKAQKEMEPGYLQNLRQHYPEIDGRSDYCVYWFRKAHDQLADGQHAGLVGTNTIRQNYTREAGLDYITQNGGTITEAVSSMAWSGDASVHVSIVNWVKGKEPGSKRLYIQEGNDPAIGWRHEDFPAINAALSFTTDVTSAKRINANTRGGCHQGQTHGHEGFLMTPDEAHAALKRHPDYRAALFPFLIADDLIGDIEAKPSRFVIDFHGLDITSAQAFKELFARVQKQVLPDREAAAAEEKKRNKEILDKNPNAKINKHHANFLKKWWVLSYPREDMIEEISKLRRYIACGQVTKRPVFEFVSSKIRPNAACMVFAHDDDYSFGVLQSGIHWIWFINRCSTLTERFRYTSNTVFDTFPWPQKPTAKDIEAVAKAARELRKRRNDMRAKRKQSFREMYRTLELPGSNPLKDAHATLDKAVRNAYSMGKTADPLAFLLELNHRLTESERRGEAIQGPGLPSSVKNKAMFISADCVTP
jgi:hypothetical protein